MAHLLQRCRDPTQREESRQQIQGLGAGSWAQGSGRALPSSTSSELQPAGGKQGTTCP